MSAVISACGKYRYRLIRNLGMTGTGACSFVMLNPSTADAVDDDPTIRRCTGYARALGCGRLEVVNLFAYRSTDPGILRGMSRDTAVGPENDKHVVEACRGAMVVCAWGNHGDLFGRASEVLVLLKKNGITLHALKMNRKSGQPAHPLYLKASAQPFPL